MKTKYHLPTEQYGFLELEVELRDNATLEEVAKLYKDLRASWNKINEFGNFVEEQEKKESLMRSKGVPQVKIIK